MKQKLQLRYYGKQAVLLIDGEARYQSFNRKRSDRESHVVDFGEGYATACADLGVKVKWKPTKISKRKYSKDARKAIKGE